MVHKKGIVISSKINDPTPILEMLNVYYYYNWSHLPTSATTSAEFTPMIWGEGSLKDINDAYQSPHIMGFNEPDMVSQANMSTYEVLSAWPAIEATGRTIVSPAYAKNAVYGDFSDFSNGLPAYRPSYDIVALHMYYPPAFNGSVSRRVERIMDYISDVYDKYGKPIWITEIGIDNSDLKYSVTTACLFMATLLPELEQCPVIDRFYWKTNSWRDPTGIGNLYDMNYELTELGEIYSKHI